MKRTFDIALSLALLLPALAIILLSAIAIRLETSGPAIFRQERVGRQGKAFQLFKLRTMYLGTQEKESHKVSKGSITKVGYYLRKSKIDELPQIWSVLVGEMSFVGPRPCLPQQAKLIELRLKQGALKVRPGITGPAQVSGVDMSTPELLAKIDSEYVNKRTFLGDLWLILVTIFGQGAGDAAQRYES